MSMKNVRNLDRKDIKRIVREQVVSRDGSLTAEMLREDLLQREIQAVMARLSREGVVIPKDMESALSQEIVDDLVGLGPLEVFMRDPEVTEIMVNGPLEVYIEKAGRKTLSDVRFDDEQHLRYSIEKMIRPTGRRVDELTPYVDFSLPGGSRANVILPPVGFGGPYVTIRKFLHSIDTLEDMIALGTLGRRMGEFLLRCVQARMNLIFSGATGSGKTTMLEVLSGYIGESERIVTIEDTLELHLRQRHVVRLLTRNPNIEGKGEITIRDLFINSLRMRPDRIILGEIRGAEALDYLQALNSGHEGALAVIHASTPEDVLLRLENMAFYSGMQLPVTSVRAQIAHGLDVIVQMAQLFDGSRKIVKISEVLEAEKEAVQVRPLFYFKGESVDDNGAVQGRFCSTGIVPRFLPRFHDRGVEIDESMFTQG